MYGFCLAVGRLKNKALSPQDIWTIKVTHPPLTGPCKAGPPLLMLWWSAVCVSVLCQGGGRGLGKNVKRGFEAWLRDNKQMVRSDVIK